MIDVASMMRLAADAVENYEARVNEAREQGAVNGTTVLEALVTLGAGATIAARELADRLPRPTARCNHESNGDLTSEVDQIVGLLGLVQEEELAALRKRVVELEKQLNISSPAKPAAKKPVKKATKKTAASKTSAKK